MKRHALLVALVAHLAVESAHGCMHPPRDYPGKMGSTIQEYLFFREGALIHMIANQRIASDRALPGEVAWVIPLPSVPVEYRTENDSLFKWLFHATEPRMRGIPKGGGSPSMGFVVHDLVQVGEYEIKPVEIIDTSSGTEINDWLFSNGYSRVPLQGLKYYLHPGACFLAIKVKKLKSKEELLRPLHIVYRAKEVRLPLKFFANAGVFDVYLYVMGKHRSGSARTKLEPWGLRNSGHYQPDSAFVKKTGIKGMPEQDAEIFRYFGERINSKGNRIEKWKEDPLILFD